MTTKTLTTVCPHCGFDSEDDELCRACGEFIDKIPGKTVPFTVVVGSWLRSNCFLKAQKAQEDIGEEANLMTPMLGSSWALHYEED